MSLTRSLAPFVNTYQESDMQKLFNCLLLAVPLTFVASYMEMSPIVVMLVACLAIVPLAKIMGEASEHVAHHTGPTVGGLVSATFGNACELIIALMALNAGLIEVVKASITGSIIANLLFVFGASLLAGGTKYKEQKFNEGGTGTSVTLLTIAAFALLLPAALHHVGTPDSQLLDSKMALAISIVLMMLYFAGLFFSLKTHKHLLAPVADIPEDTHQPAASWSLKKSIMVLLGVTLTIVFLAEKLVSSVEHAAHTMGMTPVFVGVILLAIVGNAAENSTAVLMARKNKMDLSVSLVLGSSTQIAMFVAPVVVIVGFILGKPMDLVFSQAEIIAVFASVMVVTRIVQDGKSNWLEGAMLLGLYAIVGVAFYFI
ncbi:MAG: calcium/proton exchanger [Candidatus Obscuribacter sp.]|nr:calcium/proton exchanger [Candidatus Obscuribacter sp.]